MKCVVFIFAVSAAVFVSHTVATPLDGLHRLDSSINSTIEDLKKLKEDFPGEADHKFNTSLQNRKEDISNTIDEVLQEVQKKIEEAIAEGKDVQQCNENINLELANAKSKILPAIENCFEENTPDWSAHDGSFDKVIAKGQELRKRIVEIEENCASDNPILFQRCISRGLTEIARAHGMYKQSVGLLKRDIYSSLGAGFGVVNDCLEEPLSSFKSEVERAEESALECIEQAQ